VAPGKRAQAVTNPETAMGEKREERKERAELARQHAERVKQQRKFRSRLMMVLGALAVITVGVLAARRGSQDGRVWSAEHGHWHER
jgi:hypothetical protein